MPALLERPKLSNAMARALHRHIMMERERKRQGERGAGTRAGWEREEEEDDDTRATPHGQVHTGTRKDPPASSVPNPDIFIIISCKHCNV